MTYIHELADWPTLTWDAGKLSALLADVRHRQGRLLGRMEGLGFRLRSEAKLSTLTADVVKSSAIEGEKLNAEEVRSSIARRLGLEYGGAAVAGRDVEGIVEMMLDATQNYEQPLTTERLFGWHAALFPTGRSGMHKITVGAWRPIEAGAMQVVSGPIGRENVHFEAPTADKLDQNMTTFLEWFEASNGVDPVVKAGVAHFWFVTIHPRMATGVLVVRLWISNWHVPTARRSVSTACLLRLRWRGRSIIYNWNAGSVTGWT